MKPPKLRGPYDDNTEYSNATGLACEDESLTQQHQKDETDINLIVRKYMVTGELPVHNMPPLEEDFENVTSMQDALDRVIEANQAFMQQPAEIRSRFGNEPSRFVAFCSDEKNKEEMIKMGLFSQEATNAYHHQQAALQAQREADKADAERYRQGAGKSP